MLGSPVYQARAIIEVKPESFAQVEMGDGPTSQPSNPPYFVQTECALIRSAAILKRVIQLADNAGKERGIAEGIRYLEKSLAVRQVPNTSLIEIQVSAADPSTAARVANAIASEYQEYRLQQRNRLVHARLDSLEEEFSIQQAKVAELATHVEDLRVNLRIPDAVADREDASPFMSAEILRKIESLRVDTEIDLTRQEALLVHFRNLNEQELPHVIAAAGVQDNLLSTELEQLTLVEQKLVVLREQNYGPEHRDVLSAIAQRDDLKTKITNRINGIMAGLDTRVAALNQSLTILSNEVLKATESGAEQARASRPYFAAKRELQGLLQLRTLLHSKIALERTDLNLPKGSFVEVIDEAIAPERPTLPNRGRAGGQMAAGLVICLVGMLLAKAGQGRVGTAGLQIS